MWNQIFFQRGRGSQGMYVHPRRSCIKRTFSRILHQFNGFRIEVFVSLEYTVCTYVCAICYSKCNIFSSFPEMTRKIDLKSRSMSIPPCPSTQMQITSYWRSTYGQLLPSQEIPRYFTPKTTESIWMEEVQIGYTNLQKKKYLTKLQKHTAKRNSIS